MSNFDPELTAMHTILTSLNMLEPEGQMRVLTFIHQRFKFTPPKSEGRRADPEANPHGAGGEVSLGEYFAEASPTTDAMKALVVASHIQSTENRESLTGNEINSQLKHLGYGVSNITVALSQLMNMSPRLLIQLRKDGRTKQARKTYKVTAEGLKAVNLMRSNSSED